MSVIRYELVPKQVRTLKLHISVPTEKLILGLIFLAFRIYSIILTFCSLILILYKYLYMFSNFILLLVSFVISYK